MKLKVLLIYIIISLSNLQLKSFAGDKSYFVDKDVNDFPEIVNQDKSTFQLIAHGRPGELLIEGEWKNAKEIAIWLSAFGFQHSAGIVNRKSQIANRQSSVIQPLTLKIQHLNIYGCEFGKGEIGLAAVKYLEKNLGITVSASTNLTGIDGDWKLELGQPVSVLAISAFKGNLQLDPTNLYSSTTTWVQTTVMCEGELLHTVQNGTDYIIRSGSLGIDIYSMDPVTGNLTLSQNFLNHAGYVQGALSTLVLNGVTYLYEENGNIANVYKFSGGTWSLVNEYQYTDINPAPGTNSGYVGGAQTYVVNGVPYIYALTQYAGSAGNQFNRWQIDPTTGLIIPSTQQTFSVGGIYIGTEFQIVNTAGGWKLIAATGYYQDNLRIYDMDATGNLTGTYTDIPITSGSLASTVTTNMLKQAPYIEANGNLVIAGGDQGGGQIIVYNPTTNTVVANVASPAVVESVTFGSDGTNPNYLYITSTNSQGVTTIWPQTAIFNLSTNTIVNSGTDVQGGYDGNPGFTSNNPPQYGSRTEMLVTTTAGNQFYVQQGASCSNNTDGWLASSATVLKAAVACNSGTTAVTLSATTKSNTCPTTTADISTLVTSTCPTGSSLEWHTSSTPTSSNVYSTPTQATAGTYYPFCYDSLNSCYSPAPTTGVTVTIVSPCCNAGTTPMTLSATTATNTCPNNTADISTLVSSTCPTNSTLEWHTASTPTSANVYTTPTQATAGTYYPVCHDATNNCYSPSPATGLTVNIVSCCVVSETKPFFTKN